MLFHFYLDLCFVRNVRLVGLIGLIGRMGGSRFNPFMLLTAALALAGDFWGLGVLRALAIVVDSSVAFHVFVLSNVELTKMI
jgi:hypothetical protein